MPNIKNYQTALLRAALPQGINRYIGLFTTLPNSSGVGGVEVSGGGYVRVANDSWNDDQSGVSSTRTNDGSIELFTTTAPLTGIVGWGVWDASTSGNLLVWGEFRMESGLGALINIDGGEYLRIFDRSLVVTYDSVAKANYCEESETADQWTLNNTTASANAATAPNDEVTADEIIENSDTSQFHTCVATLGTLSDDTVYTYSAVVKLGTGSRNLMFAASGKNASTGTYSFQVSLSTGVISGLMGSPLGYGAVYAGDGNWLLWITIDSESGGNTPQMFLRLLSGSSQSYNGDGTSSVYVWGGNVVPGYLPLLNVSTTSSTPVLEEASTENYAELDISDERALSALQALLPPGVIWSRDSDTDQTQLIRALSYEYSRVRRRGRDLLEEIDPRTTYELLPDWERVFGLPSECFVPTTLAGRRSELHAKMLGNVDPTKANFIDIALTIGYSVDITEFVHTQLFTCVSNCNDYLYGTDWMFVWDIVTTSSLAEIDQLVCKINELAPIHTIPRFGFSPSGWTQQTPDAGFADDFYDIAWGGGLWVVVGFGGEIQTSPDGITWTQQTGGSTYLTSAAYGNGVFVVMGGSGSCYTSDDGVTWTPRTSNFGADDIRGLTYSGGLFVAVGGSGKISTSSDGVTWTAQTSGVASALNDAHYADGLFVVVGESSVVLTSSDAINWTTESFLITGNVKGVSHNGDLWAAVGVLTPGTVGLLATSVDGSTWVQRSTIGDADVKKILSGDGLPFVAVGDVFDVYGDNYILSSWDGIVWMRHSLSSASNTLSVQNLARDDSGTWIVVGEDGLILTSDS